MKVMVMIKSRATDEGRIQPSQEVFEAMTAYNEELVKAGIMLDGAGLRPSSAGTKIIFQGGETSVVDGPFTEAKEIIGGYWVWEVRSMEEAIEWAKRCPHDRDSDMPQILELRPYATAEDFGEAYTEEVADREARLAEQIAEQHGARPHGEA
jgi:hypothetical protein